jgi:putative SOS response-associated peptidase YedK
MCANFKVSSNERLHDVYQLAELPVDYSAEVFPGEMAPIFFAEQGRLTSQLAMFGMVPPWADVKLARHTYNARSETVAEKPSFKQAWQRGQFCLIGMDEFFEPRYEGASAERWSLSRVDQQVLWLAGIWQRKSAQQQAQQPQQDLFSFSMLTINADHHPLMQQFHKSDEEKRMPVLLDDAMRAQWLAGSDPLAILQAAQHWPADLLHARAAPLPKRRSKSSAVVESSTPQPQQASLF